MRLIKEFLSCIAAVVILVTTMAYYFCRYCVDKISKARFLLLVCVLVVPVEAQTVSEMRTCVDYLAADARGGRKPGSEGMKDAQNYIRKQCNDANVVTYTQEVDTRGTKCLNVIGVLPGYYSENRIVIGAHLDHLGKKRGGIYNGADDNASGSAVALYIAKQLAKEKPRCTIEIHWYTGEEEGMTGSKAYVRRPLVPIDNYKFMLNLDMVGRMKEAGMYGQGFKFDDVLGPLYTKYPFASKITLVGGSGGSDHMSWYAAGVPVVMLHTGIHRDYHKPSDDANKINYQGMVDVCDYALDIVHGVDRDLVPHSPVDLPYILR